MATIGFSSDVGSGGAKKPKKQIKPGTPATGATPYGTAQPTIPQTSAFSAPMNATGPGGQQTFGSSVVQQAGTTNPFLNAMVGDNKGSGVGTYGSNPGYNNANTDAMTGAAAAYGYTPAGLASIYDNPQILTDDLLAAMGIINPGMSQQLSQYMDPAIAAQFILNRGQNSSDNSAINFANEYLQQMVTPGGRQPELDRLVSEILAATGGDTSVLGAYLNAGLTPDQQVSAANSLFGQTLSGQSPYAQTGYQRFAKDQGQQYLGAVAKGQPGASSYVDYLGGTPLASWVRGS